MTPDEEQRLAALVLSMAIDETRDDPFPGVRSVTRTGPESARVQLAVSAPLFTFPATFDREDKS